MKSVLFLFILFNFLPNSVFSVLFCWNSILHLLCLFYCEGVCAQHGVFLDLHTEFRPQVDFVTDIMPTGFAKHHIA